MRGRRATNWFRSADSVKFRRNYSVSRCPAGTPVAELRESPGNDTISAEDSATPGIRAGWREIMSFKYITTRAVAAVLAGLVLASCASTPNTFANADPTVDFSAYKTYGFLDYLSTDKKGYESMESNFLKVAVAQEFDRRGMVYSQDPDVLVNFYIHTKEKVRTRTVPTSGAYYGFRDPLYDTWGGYGGFETLVDQYTEGTLNIDVIDADRKKLVWEGAIVGRVTDNAIRNLEKTIDKAVREIMAGYPVRPGK